MPKLVRSASGKHYVGEDEPEGEEGRDKLKNLAHSIGLARLCPQPIALGDLHGGPSRCQEEEDDKVARELRLQQADRVDRDTLIHKQHYPLDYR